MNRGWAGISPRRPKPLLEKQMLQSTKSHWLSVAVGFSLVVAPAVSQVQQPIPLAIPLACAQGDCPKLTGAPQTAGMRSGFVRLSPGQTVGWHSTGKNEEALVVLHGKGKALIDGQPALPFVAPALVYIPPATRHNVKNTGSDALEYEYVVAPAKAP